MADEHSHSLHARRQTIDGRFKDGSTRAKTVPRVRAKQQAQARVRGCGGASQREHEHDWTSTSKNRAARGAVRTGSRSRLRRRLRPDPDSTLSSKTGDVSHNQLSAHSSQAPLPLS